MKFSILSNHQICKWLRESFHSHPVWGPSPARPANPPALHLLMPYSYPWPLGSSPPFWEGAHQGRRGAHLIWSSQEVKAVPIGKHFRGQICHRVAAPPASLTLAPAPPQTPCFPSCHMTRTSLAVSYSKVTNLETVFDCLLFVSQVHLLSLAWIITPLVAETASHTSLARGAKDKQGTQEVYSKG